MTSFSRSHWSFSSLNQYLRCPLQYYFERVLKLPRPSVSSSLVFGSAIHDTLECYHVGLQHGDEVPWNLMQLCFLESWAAREAGQRVDYKPGETRSGLTEQAIELLKLYVEQPPPTGILWVEHPLLIPIRNSQGVYLETPLMTVADLITADKGGVKVSEFKTSSRAYTEFEVDTSLQATCYVNAVWESLAKWATVEFTVLVKTKTPKIQRVATQRTEEDFARLGDIAEIVETAVANGIFYPIENPMNCASCPFRVQCRDWKPRSSSESIDLPIMEGSGACACSQN